MAEAKTISAANLCAITGLTDRRHRQIADEGLFPPPIRGQYQLAATLQGLFKYYREKLAEREQAPAQEETDFRLAKARRETAEASKAELELATLRAEVLPVDAAFLACSNVLFAVKRIVEMSALTAEQKDDIYKEIQGFDEKKLVEDKQLDGT